MMQLLESSDSFTSAFSSDPESLFVADCSWCLIFNPEVPGLCASSSLTLYKLMWGDQLAFRRIAVDNLLRVWSKAKKKKKKANLMGIAFSFYRGFEYI